MFKVALFDMDGTIIKTDHIWDEILGSFVGKANLSYFRALREKSAGKGMQQTCALLRKYFGIKGTNKDIVAAYEQRAREVIETRTIEFVEGFPEFHAQLKDQGLISCLVTNAPSYAFEPIKKKLNLHKFFGEYMYNSCMVNYTMKPDPALLLYAMDKLKVTPEECLIFEDSLQGITAARRAGIAKIIVIRSGDMINDYRDLTGVALRDY